MVKEPVGSLEWCTRPLKTAHLHPRALSVASQRKQHAWVGGGHFWRGVPVVMRNWDTQVGETCNNGNGILSMIKRER